MKVYIKKKNPKEVIEFHCDKIEFQSYPTSGNWIKIYSEEYGMEKFRKILPEFIRKIEIVMDV